PSLDLLVKREIKARLMKVRSVSVTSDGWRDRVKRNWLDLGIAWIVETNAKWEIEVVFDVDLILLPGESTGDVLETAVRESVEEFVPPDCLIATSTNDGGGDERKAAFQLVKEGNDIWCAAHKVQLVIDDCLDSKKSHPPEDCAPHREVLKKAHD